MKTGRLGWLGIYSAVLVCALPLCSRAVLLGQIDNFQDGTSQNWITGHSSLGNISTGGPAGAGDRFAQYASTGTGGTDSRMVFFNNSQWLGNYVGAGITGIGIDVDNLGSSALSLRLAFFLDSSDGYVTTTPLALAAHSGWEHTTFSLNAANFTTIGSPGAFNTLLSNFSGQLRILSSTSPSLVGDVIAGTLGIDNVQAIPEPRTIMMVGLGILVVICLRRRRQLEYGVVDQPR